MNCVNVKKLIPDYAKNDIQPEDKKIVEKHLADCRECQDELKFYNQYSRSLQNLEEVQVPDDFLHSIHKKLEIRKSWWQRLTSYIMSVRFNSFVKIAGVAGVALVLFIMLPIVRPYLSQNLKSSKSMPLFITESAEEDVRAMAPEESLIERDKELKLSSDSASESETVVTILDESEEGGIVDSRTRGESDADDLKMESLESKMLVTDLEEVREVEKTTSVIDKEEKVYELALAKPEVEDKLSMSYREETEEPVYLEEDRVMLTDAFESDEVADIVVMEESEKESYDFKNKDERKLKRSMEEKIAPRSNETEHKVSLMYLTLVVKEPDLLFNESVSKGDKDDMDRAHGLAMEDADLDFISDDEMAEKKREKVEPGNADVLRETQDMLRSIAADLGIVLDTTNDVELSASIPEDDFQVFMDRLESIGLVTITEGEHRYHIEIQPY